MWDRKAEKSKLNKAQRKYFAIFMIIHLITIAIVGGFFIYLVFWMKNRGVI